MPRLNSAGNEKPALSWHKPGGLYERVKETLLELQIRESESRDVWKCPRREN
jgi:hypothetical protein